MAAPTVVWSSLMYTGRVHLKPRGDESSLEATGVVIGVEDGAPFRLDYRVYTGPDFVFRGLDAATADTTLQLKFDGQGNWFGSDGIPLPELAGCIDIDLSATPLTNTLPIRRLRWQVGQARALRMAFITMPTLAVSVEPQRYTCLSQSAAGAVFRFEALSSDFAADLPVDANGLVLDYPGLFRRVWPSANTHPPLT
jgi:hypothetical protein